MDKLICKLKPPYDTCCNCLDRQLDNDMVEDCRKCDLIIDYCEILNTGHSFWKGDWAMVLLPGGNIEKVPLSRVYDVRHVSSGFGELVMKMDKLLFQLDRQVGKVWNI